MNHSGKNSEFSFSQCQPLFRKSFSHKTHNASDIRTKYHIRLILGRFDRATSDFSDNFSEVLVYIEKGHFCVIFFKKSRK